MTANYIHAGVFVPLLNVTEDAEKFSFPSSNNSSMKLIYWDENARASELVVTSGGDAGQQNQQDSNEAADKDALSKTGRETEVKAKKRKADSKEAEKLKKVHSFRLFYITHTDSPQTAPSQLQFWSNRHAELHGIQEAREPSDTKSPGKAQVETGLTSAPTQSYADLKRMCCYLCLRQFKSETEINKHERLSELHRTNLTNEQLVTKALAKLEKHGITPSTAPAATDKMTSEYRDRAKERRQAYGASTKFSLPTKKSASKLENEKPDNVANMAPSKGASLLGKMGWSAGEGLGAQGTGRTAPIATDMYMQGVGLGAQGGRVGDAAGEADRNTRGDYKEFLERTKDKAKERYEKMG